MWFRLLEAEAPRKNSVYSEPQTWSYPSLPVLVLFVLLEIQELQKTLATADGVKENNMTGDEKEILTTSTRADVRQGSSRKK